ncbi:MAG: PQQ-binding-like beta-propeller repeat protein, partial [Verrucomicrobiota bacterium]
MKKSMVRMGVALATMSTCAFGGTWPEWRGPAHNGVSTAKNIPTTWSKTENVAWKVELPGRSGSSPIVWDDKIFLTTPGDGRNLLICLNQDGQEVWKADLGAEKKGKHKKGSGSNPSPATDGKHIYVYFKSGDLACVDFSGKTVWKINLQKKYGEDTLWWDLGTSPVLTEDLVVVACMQSDPSPSYIAGFSKKDGKEVWKTDRNMKAPVEANQAYSTPVLVKDNGKSLLVTLGADWLTAHHAGSGKEIWRVGGLNPTNHKYFRSISGPVVSDGIAIAPYARGATLTAVKMGGEGDVTESHVAWTKKGVSADVPTPAAENGRVYVCTDKGEVHCLDIKNGKTIWGERLAKSRSAVSASPVLVDGKIVVTREDGTTFILAQGDSFEVLAENT